MRIEELVTGAGASWSRGRAGCFHCLLIIGDLDEELGNLGVACQTVWRVFCID